MTITKREKTMLIVLGIVLFVFMFYNFSLKPNLPKIDEKKYIINDAQTRLDLLEADYRNLPAFKQDIARKTAISDYLGEYLMEDANIDDSVEFVESLAAMMNHKFNDISLGSPSTLTDGENSYYGFPIAFSLVCTYEEFNDIIKLCEGSSQKVRVSGFDITPFEDDSAGVTPVVNTTVSVDENGAIVSEPLPAESFSSDSKFDVSLNLLFYSINKDSMDNLYNFSRSRFKEYVNYDGTPVFVKEEQNLANLKEEITSGRTSIGINRESSDFVVYARGILNAGDNFITYSRFNNSKKIQQSLSSKMNVTLTLNDTSYTISALEDNGKTSTINGDLQNRDFTCYIEALIPLESEEDQNLKIDVKVVNNSSKNIRVKINQIGNRVRLLDRDGTVIVLKSEKEKVYL